MHGIVGIDFDTGSNYTYSIQALQAFDNKPNSISQQFDKVLYVARTNLMKIIAKLRKLAAFSARKTPAK